MRIIHLSDIHFNMKEIKEIDNFVINPLIADLKEKREEKPIDAIFITGDLLFKGGEGKIDEGFENFNNKFIKVFEKELGITKDKIFFCPGNHDIDRNKADEINEAGLKAILTSSLKVNDFIQKNDESKINRILSYKKFETDFYKDYPYENKLSNFESNFVFDYQDKRVGVSCLNTAWRCYGNDDSGNLILGERQITNSVSFLKDCDIKLALIHHSLDDLSPFDKKDVSSYLKSSYDILFSGHSHTADTFKTMTASGELIVSIAPANWTYGVRSELTNYYNGYAIMDIDFDNNSVNIQHRIYIHNRKKYAENVFLCDSGVEEFSLKNKNKKIVKNDEKKNIEIINKQNLPKPVSFFTGRKKELEELGKALLENSIVGLFGIGGTGKSTLASKYIESLEHKNNVSWFECLESSSLDSLMESIGYKDLLEVKTKSNREKIINFIGVIERDEKIVFLDNFHSLGNKSFVEFLELFNEKSEKSKIILISRQEYENVNVNVKPISIKGLNEDSLEYAKVIIKYKGWQNDLSDEELSEVCEQVKGHPLAITLALTLIFKYGEGYRDILKKITTGDENSEALSRRLLSFIFENDNIEKDEKEFLINFSIFEGEVDAKTVNFVLEKESKKLLHNLRKNLILNLNNRKYELHPVIREFCYEKLENKKELHKKVAEYYISLCDENRIDGNLHEKLFYNLLKAEEYENVREILMEKGERLIDNGHKELAFGIISILEETNEYRNELNFIKGYGYELISLWEEALINFDKCIVEENNRKNIFLNAKIKKYEIAIKRGQIKYVDGELERFFYENKDKLHSKELVAVLNLLGICKSHLGNTSVALEMFEQCLKISLDMGYSKEIAENFNNIGERLIKKGEYGQAIVNLESSLYEYQSIACKTGIATCLSNMGIALEKIGDYETALEKHEESLKICEELGDKFGIGIRLNNIGVFHANQDKNRIAIEYFKRSLKISEELDDKINFASKLNNIASCYKKTNKNKTLEYYTKGLNTSREIADKDGIGLSLHNLGVFYYDLCDYGKALKYLEESIVIRRELETMELSITLFSASVCNWENKDRERALELFLEHLALEMKLSKKLENENEIIKFKNYFGLNILITKMKDILENKLDESLAKYIDIEKLLPNQTIEKTQKQGRNDKCACGSEKKYKNCCGR